MQEPSILSTVKDEGEDSTVPMQCQAGNNSYRPRKKAGHSHPAAEARPSAR